MSLSERRYGRAPGFESARANGLRSGSYQKRSSSALCLILLATGGAIWCRLGSPVLPASAAGYIIFGAAGIAAAALVWNMDSRIDASEKQA